MSPSPKVCSLDQLLARRRSAGLAGRTVVHCHGCFDIVHPGHISYLQFARSLGDELVVTVSADPHVAGKGVGRPLIPDDLRAASLAALECVDHVYVNPHPTAVEVLDTLRPDVYVKGREYEGNHDPRFLAERDTVVRHGGRVVFSSGDVVFSSTALIAGLDEQTVADERVRRYRQQYGLTPLALANLLNRCRGKRIVVVGDYILDRYHFCDAVGVASEGPMMTLRPLQRADYDGAAAVVALHLAGLGADATLVTSLADDDASADVVHRLNESGVTVRCVRQRKQLVTKSRYLVDGQKLMKVDEGTVAPLDSRSASHVGDLIEAAAAGADAVVFADFGYGLLTGPLLDRVLPAVRDAVPIVTADVSGRQASLLRFAGVDLLCPTEREMREATGDFASGLNAVASQLLYKTAASAALVTLGKQGLCAFDQQRAAEDPEDSWDRTLRAAYLPSLATRVVDPLGCGDALLAVATCALAAGGTVQAAAYLGSLAAALEVGQVGNHPVSSQQLLAKLPAGPAPPVDRVRPAARPPGLVRIRVTRPPAELTWTPLPALAARFDANVNALADQDAELAARLRAHTPTDPHFIAVTAGAVCIGTRPVADAPVQLRPATFPPPRAAATIDALFPNGACTEPVLVAGEDLGWLWDRLYRLPCRSPDFVGFRPPLYFAIAHLQRLWLILHLQDWQDLLADRRVRLFVGSDAIAQFGRCMSRDWTYKWPQRSVTVDATVWPDGVTLETLHRQASADVTRALTAAKAYATPAQAASVSARWTAGLPLRVLGITTRFSVFIQHSMRDWLAGFEGLGHQTQLLIEQADHETHNTLVRASACAAFRPDLVIAIGHHRQTLPGVPAHVPVAMYVQDLLPRIYSPDAGAAQGPLDFCVGAGRLHLSKRYGYPADRFLPAPVGINEHRFAPTPPTEAEHAAFGCDVAYVSHHSTPADVELTRHLQTLNSPQAEKLFRDVFDRMTAHYDSGGEALLEPGVRAMLRAAMDSTGVSCDARAETDAVHFFRERIGNALFRHQTLKWVADLGVDLRIYGRGWESHPALRRHARGVADNVGQLSAIYRASRINLQAIVTGAMHQRLFDGLAAGAFFLIRRTPIDAIGTHYLTLWDWCQRHHVRDEADFRRRADATVQQACQAVNAILGYDMAGTDLPLFDALCASADSGFMNTATAVWPEFDRVAFGNGPELRARVQTFLTNPDARRETATAMRGPVIERASYRGISARLLDLIADRLRGRKAA